jgi:hypothetical protein
MCDLHNSLSFKHNLHTANINLLEHNDLHQMLPKAELSDSETELLAVNWMQWLGIFH